MSGAARWRYVQSTGALYGVAGLIGTGYSGHGEGRNNPAMEAVPRVGPIPAGLWAISNPHDSPHTGPFTLDLTPVGHDAHGRSAFKIHGDNKAHDASAGCIVLFRAVRETIWNSGDHQLEVVASAAVVSTPQPPERS